PPILHSLVLAFMPHVHPLLLLSFFFHSSPPHRDLHSFPTRRSSDLCSSSPTSSPTPAASSSRTSSGCRACRSTSGRRTRSTTARSEEHTSELQSRGHLVCRLLLEKKKKKIKKMK